MIKIPEEVLRTLPECIDPSKIDYVPMEFHKVSRPVCRRERLCSLCDEPIPVKTRYVIYTWRRWFSIDMFFYHNVCYKAIEMYRSLSGKNKFNHVDVLSWISETICSKCTRKKCAGVSKCRRLRRLLDYQEDDVHHWY